MTLKCPMCENKQFWKLSDGWRTYTGLAAKSGIRREKLLLYFWEYVWRYNHRNLSL